MMICNRIDTKCKANCKSCNIPHGVVQQAKEKCITASGTNTKIIMDKTRPHSTTFPIYTWKEGEPAKHLPYRN